MNYGKDANARILILFIAVNAFCLFVCFLFAIYHSVQEFSYLKRKLIFF